VRRGRLQKAVHHITAHALPCCAPPWRWCALGRHRLAQHPLLEHPRLKAFLGPQGTLIEPGGGSAKRPGKQPRCFNTFIPSCISLGMGLEGPGGEDEGKMCARAWRQRFAARTRPPCGPSVPQKPFGCILGACLLFLMRRRGEWSA